MKLSRFILLLLLTLQIVCSNAQTRLKSFEIIPKETSQFSINVDHPDCATLSIYSAISGLNFESNMGKIKAYEHRPLESRYVIFLYPVKQKISVKCPGYIESELPIFSDPKAKQQYSYEVNEALGTQGKGRLCINSEPSQAVISIDGFPIPNLTTPYTINDLLAMQYRVTLKSSRYLDSTFVAIVNNNKETSLNINLKPSFGELYLSSNPSNAKVFINDKLSGNTPLNLSGREKGLDAGTYSIKLSAERYKESERSLTLKAGTVLNEEFKLEPLFGGLVANSEPSGSTLFIDDKERGITPLALTSVDNGLDAGTYSIKVVPKSELFSEETRRITIQSGKTETLEFKHVSVAAELKIESALKPYQVLLNGVLNEELSDIHQATVPAKEYRLKVMFTGEKNKAYLPYEETLKLNIGDKLTINPQFKSNLVSVNISSDTPNVKLSIYNPSNNSKEDCGISGSTIDLIPGDYYIIASKQDYLEHYTALKAQALASLQIRLLPNNSLTVLKSNTNLDKPNSLKVTRLSDQAYSLKWDKVANVDGYIIDRQIGTGEWGKGVVSIDSNITEWVDNSSGANPSYRIYCYSGNNISLAANEKNHIISITTKASQTYGSVAALSNVAKVKYLFDSVAVTNIDTLKLAAGNHVFMATPALPYEPIQGEFAINSGEQVQLDLTFRITKYSLRKKRFEDFIYILMGNYFDHINYERYIGLDVGSTADSVQSSLSSANNHLGDYECFSISVLNVRGSSLYEEKMDSIRFPRLYYGAGVIDKIMLFRDIDSKKTSLAYDWLTFDVGLADISKSGIFYYMLQGKVIWSGQSPVYKTIDQYEFVQKFYSDKRKTKTWNYSQFGAELKLQVGFRGSSIIFPFLHATCRYQGKFGGDWYLRSDIEAWKNNHDLATPSPVTNSNIPTRNAAFEGFNFGIGIGFETSIFNMERAGY